MVLEGLYGIADAGVAGDLDAAAEALLAAGAGVVQLRWKDPASTGAMLAAARRLADRCHGAGALFIVDDRVDVAALAGADGVHLGQDDLPVAEARRILPAGAIVGVSTHTPEQVRAAIADGADYLGFGPVFATTTKERPDTVVGLEGLAEAVRIAASPPAPVPVVAIGGITLDTARDVARTGAAAAAVVSDVLRADDPAARARAIQAEFTQARREARP